MVLKVFDGVAKLLRTKPTASDNATFRLHYRFTAFVLVAASVLVTADQLFGKPIECTSTGTIPSDMLSSYCWIVGTFTITPEYTGRQIHVGVNGEGSGSRFVSAVDVHLNEKQRRNMKTVAHDVDKSLHKHVQDRSLIRVEEDGTEVRYSWYQWVPVVLFFQALLCYLPHLLWKRWEGGVMVGIVEDLYKPVLDEPENWKERKDRLINYITMTLHKHNGYAYKFIFCQSLNLLNVIAQMFVMDEIFGGHFSTYGFRVLLLLGKPFEERVDLMGKIFPKLSKCNFNKFGASGSVEKIDALCLLPRNTVNEKLFVFLWMWYGFLGVWTTIQLFKDFVAIVFPYVRMWLLRARSSGVKQRDLAMVMSKCNYGDWFILNQMSMSMYPPTFAEFLVDLSDRLRLKKSFSDPA